MDIQVAITPGEPAGIGIDLCILLAQDYLPDYYAKGVYATIIADPSLLKKRAQELNLDLSVHTNILSFKKVAGQKNNILVQPVVLAADVHAGVLNPQSAPYVLKTLDVAIEGCLSNKFAALVTGPVHKGNIMSANIDFIGHTEYLAQYTASQKVAMSFYNKDLLLGLVTTHLPLHTVAQHITTNNIKNIIDLTYQAGQKLFKTAIPKIKVCGLNPHAGENGYLGKEEIDVINPLVNSYKKQGMHIIGSIPADTAFLPQNLINTDILIAMYHDQGLTALKHMAFNSTVNLTLGLPFIRTSVDHGTALDLAGTGNIQTQNMQAALELAVKLVS